MSVPHVTFPIFIPWKNGAFGTHGSGVALQFKGRHFIVTAAHVDDGDGRTQELLIAQSPDPHSLVMLPERSISTPMPPSHDRKDDYIDLAVIPIPVRMANGLRAIGATFIGFDGMPMPAPTAGAELLFTGYPEKKQHLFPLEEGRMFIEPQLSAVWIRQIPAEVVAAMHYPLETHLTGRFRHIETRQNALEPGPDALDNPHGMSGGAAWLVVGDKLCFAGIVTKWDTDGNAGHLIATRTVFLPTMLAQALVDIPDPG
jgi:hypothetical protein